MPVHRYGIKARHDRDDLVELIAMELRADAGGPEIQHEKPEDAPQIYIDDRYGADNRQVSVVGSFWEGVPEVQRPGIILDAFRKAHLPDTGIIIAMGLTPAEAEALGIDAK